MNAHPIDTENRHLEWTRLREPERKVQQKPRRPISTVAEHFLHQKQHQKVKHVHGVSLDNTRSQPRLPISLVHQLGVYPKSLDVHENLCPGLSTIGAATQVPPHRTTGRHKAQRSYLVANNKEALLLAFLLSGCFTCGGKIKVLEDSDLEFKGPKL